MSNIKVTIDTSKSYQELFNKGIIDSEWLKINDSVLLSDTAILVKRNDAIDYFAFNMDSAKRRVEHFKELDKANRGEKSAYSGIY